MNKRRAYEIFYNINSEDYTTEEMALAVHEIAGMETHNSVTKAAMLKVIWWLWNQMFEIQEETDEK